ncbi:MAG: regulatory protein GemA [Defluviitaleaceae bacterium]|nr:regulatory protein GemA [Defluviitaleaceae bacterium]MCL2273401.1 regulatory protein GemA [Defluviitaleaceae bacterium]
MAAKMSDAQRRKIFTPAREKKLDNDEMHGFIHHLTGKDSMKHLSIREAIVVIDALEGKKSNAIGMITAKQQKYIQGMAKDIGWVDAAGRLDTKRLNLWVKHRYGVDSIIWLTAKKASDAIEGMKAMHTRMRDAQAEAV